MSEDIEPARHWLAKARNDLLNADNNLSADETPFDTVCFHCQQAAEKLLKAFLVGNRQQYPFTHDLFLILEEVIPLCSGAEQLRDPLAILMPYAIEIRYPDDGFDPFEQDAREAREAAGQVLQWLESALPKVFKEGSA